jgi:hypothetical protein
VPERKSFFAEKPAGITYGSPAAPTPALPRRPVDSLESTTYQQPPARAVPRPSEDIQEYSIQLDPPGPQKVFRLDSEADLQERMRQEARQRTPVERIEFPSEPVVGAGPFVQRTFAESKMQVEPMYVCYGRLYFEDLNSERYGWDLGPIQPFVSTGLFFKDVVTLPYHALTNPCRCYECNAGYCLPGDPVPYLLYPPQLSVTGGIAEAGTALALLAIFP